MQCFIVKNTLLHTAFVRSWPVGIWQFNHITFNITTRVPLYCSKPFTFTLHLHTKPSLESLKVQIIYNRRFPINNYILNRPAKSLKSNTGGVSFCWIGIQYAMPYCQKYTPPHCFFCNFAGWVYCTLPHLENAKMTFLTL